VAWAHDFVARWRQRAKQFVSREELVALAHRSREVLLLSAITGVGTGLAVALFERVVVDGLLDRVLDLSPWLLAFLPLVGLAVAAASLIWLGRRASPATADLYLESFHDPGHELALRELPARAIAAVATLGLGGPMGLEGPSLYFGASIGTWLRDRVARLRASVDRRSLLVAGAAAGVSAIFKAPATGAVFAIEVPYQDDLARHMLLPSLIGSATSYVTFAAINGTTPLFPVRGTPPFSFADLVGAIVLGVVAGIGARAFSILLRLAKRASVFGPTVLRILVAGLAIAACFAIGELLTGEPVVVGVGYATITWALAADRAVWLLLSVLVLRCLATAATVAGGGVGGLFVPLVVAGALLGRAVGGVVGDADTTLFLVIGVAAFLGAGYRVPLAAVTFVAETTGRPGFIVPGVLAAVAAELVMGRWSGTQYQRVTARDAGEG
jgi:CIC family chloride channel protein